jgi:hypothetical protein
MAKESPLKLAIASLVAVASLVYLASTWFDVDVFQKLQVSLSSLWNDPQNSNFGSGSDFQTEISPKSSKKASDSGKNDKQGLDEPLNLNAGGNLEELGEDLMEDRLWEEGIARSRSEGVRSGNAVLEALAEIDSWSPVEAGYNPLKLSIYLRYPKIWVRLSAFAFALKARALTDKQEQKISRLITLKSRDNPAQVRRFLMRYERRDPELFELLMDRLVEPDTPLEEPSVPEIEKNSNDAS